MLGTGSSYDEVRQGVAVVRSVDRAGFRALFADAAVVFTRLPAGAPRDLAARANEAVGRGDGSLHTRAELDVLFDLLIGEVGRASELVLVGDDGRTTAAGGLVDHYLGVLLDKDIFFGHPMYAVELSGWPDAAATLGGPVAAPDGARLALWPTNPLDTAPLPPPDAAGVLLATSRFTLANTGNRTLDVGKRSWRADVAVEPGEQRFVGMSRLNLKAMWNDPSQVREALAWRALARAGVPASRHTYAKLTINGRYRGLFSLIEDVDRRYVVDRFGPNDRGNSGVRQGGVRPAR